MFVIFEALRRENGLVLDLLVLRTRIRFCRFVLVEWVARSLLGALYEVNFDLKMPLKVY